jgi:glycosyltransferase involved in cell wall biosynthesis
MFGDTSENAFLCVYVGRISKEKRMEVLIDAIKDQPGVYLAIIGECSPVLKSILLLPSLFIVFR